MRPIFDQWPADAAEHFERQSNSTHLSVRQIPAQRPRYYSIIERQQRWWLPLFQSVRHGWDAVRIRRNHHPIPSQIRVQLHFRRRSPWLHPLLALYWLVFKDLKIVSFEINRFFFKLQQGFLLGIKDEYNLCMEDDLEKTRDLCRAFLDHVSHFTLIFILNCLTISIVSDLDG